MKRSGDVRLQFNPSVLNYSVVYKLINLRRHHTSVMCYFFRHPMYFQCVKRREVFFFLINFIEVVMCPNYVITLTN